VVRSRLQREYEKKADFSERSVGKPARRPGPAANRGKFSEDSGGAMLAKKENRAILNTAESGEKTGPGAKRRDG